MSDIEALEARINSWLAGECEPTLVEFLALREVLGDESFYSLFGGNSIPLPEELKLSDTDSVH